MVSVGCMLPRMVLEPRTWFLRGSKRLSVVSSPPDTTKLWRHLLSWSPSEALQGIVGSACSHRHPQPASAARPLNEYLIDVLYCHSVTYLRSATRSLRNTFLCWHYCCLTSTLEASVLLRWKVMPDGVAE